MFSPYLSTFRGLDLYLGYPYEGVLKVRAEIGGGEGLAPVACLVVSSITYLRKVRDVYMQGRARQREVL